MKEVCDIANDTKIQSKKTWSSPTFEVISKDIIKSGAVGTGESGPTPSIFS